MLKITKLLDSALRDDDNKVVGGGNYRNLFKSKKSKNVKSGIQTYIGVTEEFMFLISIGREACDQLKQVFTKVSILQHFDLECHIRIETDTLGYAIGGILSQLIFDHLTSDYPISD